MGIPGLLAILLLYGVPIVFFARRIQRGDWQASGVALAGCLFVATFAMNGLTQSMFAHQLVASFFALVVGLLAGLCMAERRPR
jgi:O-antigen ligase